MRCRVRVAMALAIETASMKPTSVITSAVDSSVTSVSQVTVGQANAGSPEGILPTTSPPRRA